MPVAAWIALLQTVGGWFTSMYAKARMEHGDRIPSKEELLKQIEANQAEIDGGKIS